MSLQALLGALGGLLSEKAIAAVAGVTLTASGAAGLATVLDNAPADTPNFQQIAQEAEDQTNDFEVQNEEAGPDEDHAATVAQEIYAYKNGEHPEGCAFGLGVAAIASGGQAPSAEDVCTENGDNDLTGTDADTQGADNADRADDAGDNADDGLETASEESDNDTVPSDVPVDGEETGDTAASDHPDEDDNPGSDFRDDAGAPSNG
jgi:hypothetical protein